MKFTVRRASTLGCRILPLAAFFVGFFSHGAGDPFAEMVRSSDPLPAREQLKKFHLPPGFEIQLVASEPAIGKPMNIAFDTKGRLWLTQSREYPYPAPVDKPGRDKVMVLEDFDPKGGARKITTFAEGLNIPIGLYPYKNGVLTYSIPNIYYFEDTDGDGRADKKEVFLGKFGWEKDTHGMTGAFRRGYDGWLYADHGFNNDTTLTAPDGSKLTMNSGNAYRVKMDGSSVQQYSYGQVNPFGLSFDHLGDLWSSDCHSSPVYMLLRGGFYPSFGKPHDGLGFAPDICAHSHGSTAIAGMVFYGATNFPAEYHNNTFVGNVMTSRVNRDSYVERGSTRVAKEEADLVTCDDPWFRPVDMQVGPDGALYIADFYNKIIGHYEVPLDHPGRDRERGRIWRVVYTGTNAKPSPAMPSNLKGLIGELGHPNLTRRMLAMNELSDRIGAPAIKPLKKVVKDKKGNALQKVHALWVLHRLNALESQELVTNAKSSDREIRVHVMRILSETKVWAPELSAIAVAGLKDSDPYVQRAAADAVGQHPAYEHIQPLLTLRHAVDSKDSQLLHTVRMALRNQLRESKHFGRLLAANFLEADSRAIADVAIGIRNPESGQYLLKHIQRVTEDRAKLSEQLRHIARHAPSEEITELARVTRAKFADDIDFQLDLFKSVQEGTAQRGVQLPQAASEWGVALAEKLLASVDTTTMDWVNVPIPGHDTTNPWQFQDPKMPGGNNKGRFMTSLSQGGERFTGILKSKTFKIPGRLKFSIAGHDGIPDKPAQKKNLIRLRDAESNSVLMETFAPRKDAAQAVEWNLAAHAGRNGFLEVVDADTGGSYAWIAVGNFEPDVAAFPKYTPNQVEKRQMAATEMADQLKLNQLEPRLKELLGNSRAGADLRAAVAKALLTLNRAAHVPEAGAILANSAEPPRLREKVAQLLGQGDSSVERDFLVQTMANASRGLQTQIALALAGSAGGAEALLKAIEEGKVSPRVLQESGVSDRLNASKLPNIAARISTLTKNLSPVSAEKQKVIDQRRLAFSLNASSAQKGAEIFTRNCAICHQLEGQGAIVGPQLDGVGNRGADRLLEDILDPNRNVDHAFRYSNVTLKDDQVITGLFRREEGQVLIFADATGKEISVPKDQIAGRQESENSLMPDNFDETLAAQDLNDLISFMLTKSSATKK